MSYKLHFFRAAAAGAVFLSSAASATDAAGDRMVPVQRFAPSVQTAAPIHIDGGCAATQPILDPSMEATDGTTFANPNWNSTSTNFGTALCNVAACGGVGPHTGTFWAWFGGIAAAENATLSQTLIIPSTGPRYLNFWMWISGVAAPFTDTLTIKIDGTTLRTFTEPSVAEPAWTQRSVDISAFANGASHTISFELIHPAGGGTGNFHVDDTTSDCAQMPVEVQSYQVE
jgi:hypothetical protein